MGRLFRKVIEIKLPEGAFSLEGWEKILAIYLSHLTDDDMVGRELVDSIKYLDVQMLESSGQIKKAKALYKSLILDNPKSKTLRSGLERTSQLLN